jgi:hypothetical protein
MFMKIRNTESGPSSIHVEMRIMLVTTEQEFPRLAVQAAAKEFLETHTHPPGPVHMHAGSITPDSTIAGIHLAD